MHVFILNFNIGKGHHITSAQQKMMLYFVQGAMATNSANSTRNATTTSSSNADTIDITLFDQSRLAPSTALCIHTGLNACVHTKI